MEVSKDIVKNTVRGIVSKALNKSNGSKDIVKNKVRGFEIEIPDFTEEELEEVLIEMYLMNSNDELIKKIMIKRKEVVGSLKLCSKFSSVLPLLGLKGLDILSLLIQTMPRANKIKILCEVRDEDIKKVEEAIKQIKM